MSYDVYIGEFKDGEAWSVTEYDNNGKVTAAGITHIQKNLNYRRYPQSFRKVTV